VNTAVQVLRETGQSLSAPEIKALLIDGCGLPAKDVDNAMKSLMANLRTDPRVAMHVLADEPAASDTDADSAAPKKARSKKTAVTRSVARFSWVGPGPDQPGPDLANSDTSVPFVGGSDAEPAQAAPALALTELLQSPDLPSSLEIGHVPVALAASVLVEFDEKAIAGMCERFSTAQRWDLACLLLATPRPSKSVRALVQRWDSGDEAQVLMGRGLAWIVAGAEPEAASRVAHAVALRGPVISEQVLESCLACLHTAPEGLVESLLKVVDAAKPPLLEMATGAADVDRLLRVTANRPIRQRLRLLWAAWRTDPATVRSTGIWSPRPSVTDVEQWAATTPDSRLMDDPWIQENVVGPVVRAYVREADRRPAVGRVLSWPSPLFDAVELETLIAMVHRAGSGDARIAAIVSAIAQDERVRALREQVTAAEHAAQLAVQAAEAAQDEAREARQAQQAAFSRAAQAEQSQLRASHDEVHRAHLDALRAASDIVAAVGRLRPDAAAGDALQDALAAAARHGLAQIGPVGAVVSFDPLRHECLGPLTSDEVEIREIGLEWDDPEGPVILRRAAVVSRTT
jgi:hypothetical protein